MRKTKNVIGFFEGTEYPDRYVIFGNHRDAWVFGAMDPNSGTTIMLEGEKHPFLNFYVIFFGLCMNYIMYDIL